MKLDQLSKRKQCFAYKSDFFTKYNGLNILWSESNYVSNFVIREQLRGTPKCSKSSKMVRYLHSWSMCHLSPQDCCCREFCACWCEPDRSMKIWQFPACLPAPLWVFRNLGVELKWTKNMVEKLFFSITFEKSTSSNHLLSNASGHIKNASRSPEIGGLKTACSQGGGSP